jgi:hypothetical protein
MVYRISEHFEAGLNAFPIWDRCHDFKKYFCRKNWRFLTQNTASLHLQKIITLVFKKNAILGRKLVKMAEKM